MRSSLVDEILFLKSNLADNIDEDQIETISIHEESGDEASVNLINEEIEISFEH